MRQIVYGIAALVSVGIMIYFASAPEAPSTPDLSTPEIAMTAAAGPGQITLEVPDMHCQFACFPKVKETLEASPTVKSVTLAEQPESGFKPQVVVDYDAGFDSAAAIDQLAQTGYAGSQIVP